VGELWKLSHNITNIYPETSWVSSLS